MRKRTFFFGLRTVSVTRQVPFDADATTRDPETLHLPDVVHVFVPLTEVEMTRDKDRDFDRASEIPVDDAVAVDVVVDFGWMDNVGFGAEKWLIPKSRTAEPSGCAANFGLVDWPSSAVTTSADDGISDTWA